jgi:LuxR family transcriptional regulator
LILKPLILIRPSDSRFRPPIAGQGAFVSIHSLVQSLIVLEECKQPQGVVEELRRTTHSYRFEYYGLLRHLKLSEDPERLILAGHWPENWHQTYIEKRYILIDPTIRYLARAQRPFRWKESLAAYRRDPSQRRMEQMMADAHAHGLRDGYIFPIHGRNGVLGHLTVGGGSVELSPVEISLFEMITRKAFWRLLELKGEAKALESATSLEIPLTRREMEILHYLADGLTSVEIGKVLKISNHTVDWYMNGLQQKLKAKNRQQAVALAFRHGLVT